MSEKVIPLRGELLPGQADPQMVAELERLLEQARRGELRAFAFAVFNANDDMVTGWQGGAGTRWPLAAAVGMLQHRYIQRLYEGTAP